MMTEMTVEIEKRRERGVMNCGKGEMLTFDAGLRHQGIAITVHAL
jgi:hypothetical protein